MTELQRFADGVSPPKARSFRDLRVAGTGASRFRSVGAADAHCKEKWAILDSNQGPPPYQSGALTS
jgi:hypothetical protein